MIPCDGPHLWPIQSLSNQKSNALLCRGIDECAPATQTHFEFQTLRAGSLLPTPSACHFPILILFDIRSQDYYIVFQNEISDEEKCLELKLVLLTRLRLREELPATGNFLLIPLRQKLALRAIGRIGREIRLSIAVQSLRVKSYRPSDRAPSGE